MHIRFCVVWFLIFLCHLLTSFYCVASLGYTSSSLELLSNEVHYLKVMSCLEFKVCFVGFRYPTSSRQTSHEEGKEWLRSHSTGGLQDTGSQSPLSPPGASCTTTGKYHYSNLCESKGKNLLCLKCVYRINKGYDRHMSTKRILVIWSVIN